jgi:hypothetical protein
MYPFVKLSSGGSLGLCGGVEAPTAYATHDLAPLDYSIFFDQDVDFYLEKNIGYTTDATKYTVAFSLKMNVTTGNYAVFSGGAFSASVAYRGIIIKDGSVAMDVFSGGQRFGYFTESKPFKDTSSWHHVVVVYDSTNGPKIWIDGVSQTLSSNSGSPFPGSVAHTNNWFTENQKMYLGKHPGLTDYNEYKLNGQLAMFALIDGVTVTNPNDFGAFDDKSGQWIPKVPNTSSWTGNSFLLTGKDIVNRGGVRYYEFTGKPRHQIAASDGDPIGAVFHYGTEAEWVELVSPVLPANATLNFDNPTTLNIPTGALPIWRNNNTVMELPANFIFTSNNPRLTVLPNNPDKGIVVKKYTGTGNAQAIDLGFPSKPTWMVIKAMSGSSELGIWHKSCFNNELIAPGIKTNLFANKPAFQVNKTTKDLLWLPGSEDHGSSIDTGTKRIIASKMFKYGSNLYMFLATQGALPSTSAIRSSSIYRYNEVPRTWDLVVDLPTGAVNSANPNSVRYANVHQTANGKTYIVVMDNIAANAYYEIFEFNGTTVTSRAKHNPAASDKSLMATSVAVGNNIWIAGFNTGINLHKFDATNNSFSQVAAKAFANINSVEASEITFAKATAVLFEHAGDLIFYGGGGFTLATPTNFNNPLIHIPVATPANMTEIGEVEVVHQSVRAKNWAGEPNRTVIKTGIPKVFTFGGKKYMMVANQDLYKKPILNIYEIINDATASGKLKLELVSKATLNDVFITGRENAIPCNYQFVEYNGKALIFAEVWELKNSLGDVITKAYEFKDGELKQLSHYNTQQNLTVTSLQFGTSDGSAIVFNDRCYFAMPFFSSSGTVATYSATVVHEYVDDYGQLCHNGRIRLNSANYDIYPTAKLGKTNTNETGVEYFLMAGCDTEVTKAQRVYGTGFVDSHLLGGDFISHKGQLYGIFSCNRKPGYTEGSGSLAYQAWHVRQYDPATNRWNIILQKAVSEPYNFYKPCHWIEDDKIYFATMVTNRNTADSSLLVNSLDNGVIRLVTSVTVNTSSAKTSYSVQTFMFQSKRYLFVYGTFDRFYKWENKTLTAYNIFADGKVDSLKDTNIGYDPVDGNPIIAVSGAIYGGFATYKITGDTGTALTHTKTHVDSGGSSNAMSHLINTPNGKLFYLKCVYAAGLRPELLYVNQYINSSGTVSVTLMDRQDGSYFVHAIDSHVFNGRIFVAASHHAKADTDNNRDVYTKMYELDEDSGKLTLLQTFPSYSPIHSKFFEHKGKLYFYQNSHFDNNPADRYPMLGQLIFEYEPDANAFFIGSPMMPNTMGNWIIETTRSSPTIKRHFLGTDFSDNQSLEKRLHINDAAYITTGANADFPAYRAADKGWREYAQHLYPSTVNWTSHYERHLYDLRNIHFAGSPSIASFVQDKSALNNDFTVRGNLNNNLETVFRIYDSPYNQRAAFISENMNMGTALTYTPLMFPGTDNLNSGNRQFATDSINRDSVLVNTLIPPMTDKHTGDLYFEISIGGVGTAADSFSLAFMDQDNGPNAVTARLWLGNTAPSASKNSLQYRTGDVIGFYFDYTAKEVTFTVNGTVDPNINKLSAVGWGSLAIICYDWASASSEAYAIVTINCGHEGFRYAPNKDVKTLCAADLVPYYDIINPKKFMVSGTYVGNGNTGPNANFVDVGFTPDIVIWNSAASGGSLRLLVREWGDDKHANINSTGQVYSGAGHLQYKPNGFNVDATANTGGWVGPAGNFNSNGQTYHYMAFKASTCSGIDVIRYTGDGTTSQALFHNLGGIPDMAWILSESESLPVYVFSRTLGARTYFTLNGTAPATTLTFDTFTFGDNNVSVKKVGGATAININEVGKQYTVILFRSVYGFSHYGVSKNQNYASSSGNIDWLPMIPTGFKPASVIMKQSQTATAWTHFMFNETMFTSGGSVVGSNNPLDAYYAFKDIGFKPRDNDPAWHLSGGDTVFMTWAEKPWGL